MKNKTTERQDRLNEALRKNLKRRKIQLNNNKLEKK